MVKYATYETGLFSGRMARRRLVGCQDKQNLLECFLGFKIKQEIKNKPKQLYNILIMDTQIDFLEGGALAIEGATNDAYRLIDLLTSYPDMFNLKVSTLDTHTPNHIGHPGYWKSIETNDYEPEAWTVFSYDANTDTIKGSDGKTYEPKDTSLLQWTKDYVKNIESYGKGAPLIWPVHCLEGTYGHNLFPPLKELLDTMPNVEYFIKAQNNLSEMYSIFMSEIPVPLEMSTKELAYIGGITNVPSDSNINEPNSDKPGGYYLNTNFNAKLYNVLNIKNNPLLICGQALSHCVNWSIRDYVNKYLESNNMTRLLDNQIILIIDASTAIPGFESSVNDLLMFCKEKNVTLKTCVEVKKMFADMK